MIYLLGGYVWLFVHRPFEVWPALAPLQLERVYMLVTLLVWLVYPNKGFVSNRVHFALAVSTAALVVSWLVSPYAGHPGCADVVETYAKVAVFYVLMVTTVRDEKSLRLLVLFFVASVGLYTAHSLLEWMNGRYQYRMGVRRMIGVDTTYGDPNAFASTMLYTLPLLLPFWNETPRRISRWLIGGFVLVLLFCILKTGSRAAFLALGGLACIVVVTSARRKFQAVALCAVGGLFGAVVLSAILPDDMQNRYLTIIDSSRGPANAAESADGRINGIVLGWQLFQRSPLFGNGPASFVHVTKLGLQPHNLYGQVLSELGVCGALGLASMVTCFFLNWRESRRLALADPYGAPANDFTYQVARAVGINVVLLLVMGFAGHNLFRYNWQWFAAFSAIALHCLRVRAEARACAGEAGYLAPQAAWL